jgi:hypothetical protein
LATTSCPHPLALGRLVERLPTINFVHDRRGVLGGAGEGGEERRAAREALGERLEAGVERVRALHLEVCGADMPAGGGTSFNALTVNN